MSAKRRRTPRDARRRSLGQNFLVDRSEISRLLRAVEVQPDQLIVEVGAGSGALTVPLARAGARVLAVEPDPAWVRRLRNRLTQSRVGDRVEIVGGDFRSITFPTEPFRVVSNPPFGQTTALLQALLDNPTRGPWRADVLVQSDVARKRVATPPTSLRSAAWAPWWIFQLGPQMPRTAFRPIPTVDATLLMVHRREPAILPEWLAPNFRGLLRPGWNPPHPRRRSKGLP